MVLLYGQLTALKWLISIFNFQIYGTFTEWFHFGVKKGFWKGGLN